MPNKEHLIKMQCRECKRINYRTFKNRKQNPDPLELNKFCKWCRKATPHKEMKKT